MKLFQKRILLFFAIFLFLTSLIFAATYLKSVADYKKAVKETTFSGISISNIPDGIYIGEYDVDFIYAKVKVTVQNRTITGIELLKELQTESSKLFRKILKGGNMWGIRSCV